MESRPGKCWSGDGTNKGDPCEQVGKTQNTIASQICRVLLAGLESNAPLGVDGRRPLIASCEVVNLWRRYIRSLTAEIWQVRCVSD